MGEELVKKCVHPKLMLDQLGGQKLGFGEFQQIWCSRLEHEH